MIAIKLHVFIIFMKIKTIIRCNRFQRPGLKFYRKILDMTCTKHVTNQYVRSKMEQAIGKHDEDVRSKMEQAIGKHDEDVRSKME